MGKLILRGPLGKKNIFIRSVPGFPDKEKFRVANLAVFVNIHLIQTLPSLGHLVLNKPSTGLDHFKHLGWKIEFEKQSTPFHFLTNFL